MINSAVLMGRLTADPELKSTTGGNSVTSFTIAVDRAYQKKGEEKQTDFINIVAWRQTAEFVTRYFHKGSMIAVQGEIQTRKYEDKQGNNRTAFEVIANNVSFCGGKSDSEASDYPPIAKSTATASQPNSFDSIDDDDDDTLPF